MTTFQIHFPVQQPTLQTALSLRSAGIACDDRKAKVRARAAAWRKANPDRARASVREWRKKNKDRQAELSRRWAEQNHERRKEQWQRHYNRIKPAVLEKLAKRWRSLSPDSDQRVYHRVFVRIAEALPVGVEMAGTVEELIGCSIAEFRSHIERQFRDGMGWSVDGWHIDHILPVSFFDLSNPDQQRKCFHFTNTQPLWASENSSKGNRVVIDGVEVKPRSGGRRRAS